MSEVPSSQSTNSDQQLEAIRSLYRGEPQTSDWLVVTQDLIDRFGSATFDEHWIHIDPERARRESPFGGTVAHGFWTLSLLPYLSQSAASIAYPPGIQFGLNYGLNQVRFPGPAPVGARIRLRHVVLGVETRGGGRYLIRTENVIEVDGQERPALVAEWLFMLIGSVEP